jgi:hypothetical protein
MVLNYFKSPDKISQSYTFAESGGSSWEDRY